MMNDCSNEELVALASSVTQATRDAVTAPFEEAKVASVERGFGERPQFVMAFSSAEFKEASLTAVLDVCGGLVPIVGGAMSGSMLDPSVLSGVAFSNGSGDTNTFYGSPPGLVGFFCWPSVHAAGAFSSGLQADPTCPGGIVTKTRGPNIIEEIDHRPATEVVREWCPMSDEFIADQVKKSEPFGLGGKAFSWMDYTTNDVENGNEDGVPFVPLGAVIGIDESSGEEIHKLACPGWINPTGGFSSLVSVEEGTKLTKMIGRRSDSVARTARVATQVVKNAGVDTSRVVGAFSYSCGMNLFYGGRAGMNTLAENLSDRLGWVPTLGLCGGPEFGCQGDAKSCVGSYMYSCAVFTNIPVTEKLSGTGFATISAGKRASMSLSNHGSAMVTEE